MLAPRIELHTLSIPEPTFCRPILLTNIEKAKAIRAQPRPPLGELTVLSENPYLNSKLIQMLSFPCSQVQIYVYNVDSN